MSLHDLHREEISSVSRIIKKSSGSYSFRVEGYSGLTSKVGDSAESPEFTLCDHLWQLRLFPGGSLEEHKNFVSYYIASKSQNSAKASYKLSICSQVYGGADESFTSSGVRLFEAKGSQIDGNTTYNMLLCNIFQFHLFIQHIIISSVSAFITILLSRLGTRQIYIFGKASKSCLRILGQ